MQTIEAIKIKEQKIARLERTLALSKLKERKADARRKIEFGGLVIKSQMGKYSKAIILGALIEAFESLERDAAYHALFKAKGDAAFLGYSNN